MAFCRLLYKLPIYSLNTFRHNLYAFYLDASVKMEKDHIQTIGMCCVIG